MWDFNKKPTMYHKLADYGLAAFYDAASIKAGEDWASSLRQNAGRGMLIVLQTDVYASRPWCQTEMLTAKRQDVPIIVGLMVRQGESRSFPHSGNLRTVALPTAADSADQAALILIAAALRETLSLACWRGSLDPAQAAGYKILSRPPEPARLVGEEGVAVTYLYPAPPPDAAFDFGKPRPGTARSDPSPCARGAAGYRPAAAAARL